MQNYLSKQFDLNDQELIPVLDELPLWSAPFGLKLLDTIRMKRNMKVLDIGCGTGFPLIEIAQRLGNSSEIYGIDPWERALDRVKTKIRITESKNVKLINAEAESVPFSENFFDLVVSNNGINNVNDQQVVYNECFRVCKQGAQFVFTFNLPGTMVEFYTLFEQTLKIFGLASEINLLKEHISEKRKTKEATVVMVEKAGFTIDSIKEDLFELRYLDGTTFLNHFFIKLAFVEPWKNIVPENRLKDFFEVLEKNLNIFAKTNGELSLSIPFACFDCTK